MRYRARCEVRTAVPRQNIQQFLPFLEQIDAGEKRHDRLIETVEPQELTKPTDDLVELRFLKASRSFSAYACKLFNQLRAIGRLDLCCIDIGQIGIVDLHARENTKEALAVTAEHERGHAANRIRPSQPKAYRFTIACCCWLMQPVGVVVLAAECFSIPHERLVQLRCVKNGRLV